MRLCNADGRVEAEDDGAVRAAAAAVRNGEILAFKGLGGYLLLCDAADDAVVQRLRARKQREAKPLPTVAVSDERWRYVMFTGPKGGIREQLYDFGSDRLEGENVVLANPENAARMREIAKEYLEQEPAWEQAAPDLELDEMQLNQLRALGYAVP